MTPLEADLFAILFQVYPRELPIKEVIKQLYARRRDGGPLTARDTVHQHKMELTRKLETRGWTIENESRCYRLMKVY